MSGMASLERLAAASLGRVLTAEAVGEVLAELGVCVRPVLRRVNDRQTGAVILGHASAAMTMDLYGHLIDQNLWDAAANLDRLDHRGGTTRAPKPPGAGTTKPQARCWASDLGLRVEPPVGIEPTTYSLRARSATLPTGGSRPLTWAFALLHTS